MTISRCDPLLGVAAALALCGCEASTEPVDPQVASLKQIIESGVRNPEMIDLLNKRIDLLNSRPEQLERELRAEAAEIVMSSGGCGTWLIVGSPRRSLLGRDDTVRARVELCPNNPAQLRTTTVTFGAA
ncbi:MAG TPA: hypothetical protein VEY69_15025 [Lautropia sp.]|jgi:hypothetical protein|nr:hypothetical protein [Lautropia sp.]